MENRQSITNLKNDLKSEERSSFSHFLICDFFQESHLEGECKSDLNREFLAKMFHLDQLLAS